MGSPSPTPVGRIAVAALVGGAVAGGAGGVIDGLWSWSAASQFLPGAGGRIGMLVYLGSTHALATGAIVAVAAVALAALGRWTRLGDVVGAGLDAHRRRPEASLALIEAAIPIVLGVVGLGLLVSNHLLVGRKHIGLMLASATLIGLVAVAAGLALAFVVARPLEALWSKIMEGRPQLREAMSRPSALGWTAACLVAACGSAGLWYAWPIVEVINLRPLWVGVVIAVLLPPGIAIGARAAGRMSSVRPALRRGGVVAGMLAVIALLLVSGGPEGVRKASATYSGLGGGLTLAFQKLGDLDRDGYSRFLGGGDCDDWDAEIHPGASEIPDDGKDNNCVGGDATLSRSADDVGFGTVPDSVPENFNVLLITIDTLRADHVGAYGYKRPTTPALDQIAKDGVVFDNAWAHAPSTRYSVPAILCGKHPLEVDYFDIPRQWPGIAETNDTIAEILHRRGLSTGAILNYWYFDKLRRMNQGFDYYDNANKRLHKGVPGEGPAKTTGSSSKEQTDKALGYLTDHGAERFFLWVHYYDPHYDYELHHEVQSFGNADRDRYDNEILYTDSHIGRLIDQLRASGLYERTVIVVTGDHGEGFGEHGINQHGYHLYAAQTKVPLIVRVPGTPPGRVTTPAGHVDLLPTLANLAGAPPSAQMRGRSLVPMIADASARDADRVVYQQLSYENNNEYRGAASKHCHVIYNVSPNTSWEIYRVDQDPYETRDISDDPGECASVRKDLERWYDSSEIPPGAAEALLKAPPQLSKRTEVDFGAEVRLLDVDLPSEVRRGSSFVAEYTWEARGTLRGDWKVFAHFEATSGGRFIGDHEPVRPFAWWHSGDYIRYRRTVTVPKTVRPGDYTLWLGLFRGNDRRPANSASVDVRDNRAAVGKVRVVQ